MQSATAQMTLDIRSHCLEPVPAVVQDALDVITDYVTQAGVAYDIDERGNNVIGAAKTAGAIAQGHLAGLEHEVFAALWLDTRNRLIEYEELFRGTVNGSAVYIREVCKRALHHNAAGVIFAHNHPSGDPSPSHPDHQITLKLKDALKMLDINVLDHVVVAPGAEPVSMAETGWI